VSFIHVKESSQAFESVVEEQMALQMVVLVAVLMVV
jgi:hypothetical protein